MSRVSILKRFRAILILVYFVFTVSLLLLLWDGIEEICGNFVHERFRESVSRLREFSAEYKSGNRNYLQNIQTLAPSLSKELIKRLPEQALNKVLFLRQKGLSGPTFVATSDSRISFLMDGTGNTTICNAAQFEAQSIQYLCGESRITLSPYVALEVGEDFTPGASVRTETGVLVSDFSPLESRQGIAYVSEAILGLLLLFWFSYWYRTLMYHFEVPLEKAHTMVMKQEEHWDGSDLPDEFQFLYVKLQEFNAAIRNRFLFLALLEQFYRNLNLSRKSFREYYDDFFYLASDFAGGRFRWRLVDKSELKQDTDNGIALELDPNSRSVLQTAFPQIRDFYLNLDYALTSEERAFFRQAFRVMIARATLEKKKREQELIQSESALAESLRTELGFRETCLVAEETEFHCSFVSPPGISSDFSDCWRHKHVVHFYMGDVFVSGIAGLIWSVTLKSAVDGFIRSGLKPHEVISRLNGDYLHREHGMQLGCVVGNYDLETGVLVFSSAGYPPVFIKQGERNYWLKSNCPPAGWSMEQQFNSETIHLKSGDLLRFMSNGWLFEALRKAGVSEIDELLNNEHSFQILSAGTTFTPDHLDDEALSLVVKL